MLENVACIYVMNCMYARKVLVPEEQGRLLTGTIIPFKLMVSPKDYIIKSNAILFLIIII